MILLFGYVHIGKHCACSKLQATFIAPSLNTQVPTFSRAGDVFGPCTPLSLHLRVLSLDLWQNWRFVRVAHGDFLPKYRPRF